MIRWPPPPFLLVSTSSELQQALRDAPETTCIILAPGCYLGPFHIRRSVSLRAAPGGEVLLDGQGQGCCLEVDGEHPRIGLTGLTLCHGLAERGGGLCIQGQAQVGLCGCVIRDNAARGDGGGIALRSGSLVLARCRIVGNRAERGGGLALGGATHARLQDCLVVDNQATSGGGIALSSGGEVELVYSTLAGNQAGLGEALLLYGGDQGRVVLRSSILAGQEAESSATAVAIPGIRSGSQPLAAYSSLLPPELADRGWTERWGGVLFERPRFAPPPAPRWTLLPDSPGTGLGRPEDLGPGGVDLAGRPRLWHDLPAVGACSVPRAQPDPGRQEESVQQLQDGPAPAPQEPSTEAPVAPAPAVGSPYTHVREHRVDLLLAAPLLLQRHLGRHWFQAARSSGHLSDLFVSLEEVFLRLSGQAAADAAPRPAVPPLIELPSEAELETALGAVRTREQARRAASRDAGLRLPADVLAEAFALTPLVQELIWTLVALQSDLGLYRVASFAWGDPAARQPTLGFLLDLVAGNSRRREELLADLAPGTPIRRWGLLELGEPDGWSPRTPELFRTVAVPDRVVRFLEGSGTPDEELPEGALRRLDAPAPLEELLLPPRTRAALDQAAIEGAALWHVERTLVLSGEPGVGRGTLAAALARSVGRGAHLIDASRLAEEQPGLLHRQMVAALREALLHETLPVLRLDREPSPALPDGVVETARHTILAAVAAFPRLAVVVCREGSRAAIVDELPRAQAISVARPDRETQLQLWRGLLAREGWHTEQADGLEQLVGAYDLAPSEMVRAVRLLQAQGGGGGAGVVSRQRLIEAVRSGIRHQLGDLAERVTTTLTWADAILPDDVRQTLAEVVAYARHRDRVFRTWGFQRKAGGHFGLSVLFSGPPGTGKTMTASLIGADLGREVFRIDLSRVVDKYIGETEKNLARLFDQAEKAQVILLFDEADSLFSSRTQVKSSNDRYANLEVNYLLQRMEAYSGMSILTTNFDMGLDTAFQRRLRFRISFKMPGVDERERLWRAMMPDEAEQEADLDWRGLAEEYEMAGGNIKNAIIRAAVLASDQGRPIGSEHLFAAALAEFREMGRLA